MSRSSPGQRWRLHAALVAGLSLCVVAFLIELHRARTGHLAAWAYVVEWPMFAVGGALLWWRLLHDHEQTNAQGDGAARRGATRDATAAASQDASAGGAEDPELVAWREYVDRLRSGEDGPS